MDEISIYIHIPFCERKCYYCAFNSFCADEEQKQTYLNALKNEIIRRKTDRIVKSIYIGGGTPSILNSEEIEEIVKVLYDNYQIYDNAEFTIEANPNSINEDLLKKWKSLRVNRVSLGIQSLNDKTLKSIGRLHDKKTAIKAIELTRKYFDNVSCDLIVGLENETGKDLCSYASEFIKRGVKHISCYLLEVYPNTLLFKMCQKNEYKPLNDAQTIQSFNKLSNYLVDKGFERYEISNFALPSYESKHNLNYWTRGDYLGFGISAHSFIDEHRIENASNLHDYEKGIFTQETLSSKEIVEEIIMLGLRCKIGVNLSNLKDYDITKNVYFNDYISQGILIKKDDVIYLNPLYYHLSNTIISNLLP